jgi:hypothetical protein
MLGLAAVPWTDRLMIRAGRPELASQWQGPFFFAVLGFLIATTVGALVASRRPRHPVGWLLLGFSLSQTASGSSPGTTRPPAPRRSPCSASSCC